MAIITLQTGRTSTMEVNEYPKEYGEFKNTRAYTGLESGDLPNVLIRSTTTYANEIMEYYYGGPGTELAGGVHGYHFADKIVVFFPIPRSEEAAAIYAELGRKMSIGLRHLSSRK